MVYIEYDKVPFNLYNQRKQTNPIPFNLYNQRKQTNPKITKDYSSGESL